MVDEWWICAITFLWHSSYRDEVQRYHQHTHIDQELCSFEQRLFFAIEIHQWYLAVTTQTTCQQQILGHQVHGSVYRAHSSTLAQVHIYSGLHSARILHWLDSKVALFNTQGHRRIADGLLHGITPIWNRVSSMPESVITILPRTSVWPRVFTLMLPTLRWNSHGRIYQGNLADAVSNDHNISSSAQKFVFGGQISAQSAGLPSSLHRHISQTLWNNAVAFRTCCPCVLHIRWKRFEKFYCWFDARTHRVADCEACLLAKSFGKSL